MALTAKPQSAFPSPSWDETIVPALRKRLQDESRVLAKRMSTSSMGTEDDSHYDIYDAYAEPDYPRPTAIPRPNASAGRPSISESVTSYRPQSRTDRTAPPLSKPSGSPPLGRTTSPHANGVIPTRIPVARTRTGSMSSYAHVGGASMAPRSESRNGMAANGNGAGNGQANGSTKEYAYHPTLSTPDLAKLSSARSERTPTQSSPHEVPLDDPPPRMSTDSEERPYEHWYRGEVSRNGGVGEYRVGRRQEMLEIANYGHKAASPRLGPDWQSDSLSRRRRGSLSARPRESFYLDPDAQGAAERVLDESPPSGVESDSAADYTPPRATTPMSPQQLARAETLPPSSLLPAPTRQMSEPPRTPTPTRTRDPPGAQATPRASAVNTSSSASGSSARVGSATPQSTQKRRAKSPAAATPPSSKKKPKAPAVAQLRKREDEYRRSIAEYPVPDEDADMSNAIPTWTQPVPTNGNWDDVVLPVVARKKGLDGHYVQADGSPQTKFQPEAIPPAPGTFGYDYSKYRPPSATQPEMIPMDDFRQQQREPSSRAMEDDETGPGSDRTTPTAPAEHTPWRPDAPLPPPPMDTGDASTHGRTPTLPSPAPFSHYAPNGQHSPSGEMTLAHIPIPTQQQQHQQIPEDDGSGGGCCKCVIM